MINCSSGDAFGVLSCQFWNTVLQCGVRLPIHTLNYFTEQSVVPAFQLVARLTMIFPIVDLWQCCVCCTRGCQSPSPGLALPIFFNNNNNNNPLLLRTLFNAPQALYRSFILCTISLSYPPSAATCDPRYLKQSTSSNGSRLISHAFGPHHQS